jgi:hypothetical protein
VGGLMDPSSWPSDWPIQSDDPLRGWSGQEGASASVAAVPPGAARATPRRNNNNNNKDDDDDDDEEDEDDDDNDDEPQQQSNDEMEESDHLLPGEILRAMGTADVHWTKGASSSTISTGAAAGGTAANAIVKKYLVILPGLLSLNHQYSTSTSSSSNAAATSTSIHQPAPAASPLMPADASSSTAPDVNAATILGRFHPPDPSSQSGVATLVLNCGSNGDNQTYNTNGQRAAPALRMEGRAVKTSGKFVWITNLQRKKRTVTCKHVFDSVLVFGNATSNVVTTTTAGAAATAANVSRDGSVEANDHNVPLHHYGTSHRTVDGGNGALAPAGSATTPRRTPMKPPPPRATLAPPDVSSAPTNGAKRKRVKKVMADTDSSDDSSEESSQDGAEDKSGSSKEAESRAFSAAASPPDNSGPQRRSQRASAQTPVRYREDAAEIDEDGNGSDGSSDGHEKEAGNLGTDDRDDSDRGRKRDALARGGANRSLRGAPRSSDLVDLTQSDDNDREESRTTSRTSKKRRLFKTQKPTGKEFVTKQADAAAAQPSPSRTEGEELIEVEAAAASSSDDRQADLAGHVTGNRPSISLLENANKDPQDRTSTVERTTTDADEVIAPRSTDEERSALIDDSSSLRSTAPAEPIRHNPTLTVDESAEDAIEGSAMPKAESIIPNLPNAAPSSAREASSATRRRSPSAKTVSVLEETALAPPPPPRKSLPPSPKSNPTTARPSSSSPVRIRKTPRPKKKKMSVLDYVKDDGGFD